MPEFRRMAAALSRDRELGLTGFVVSDEMGNMATRKKKTTKKKIRRRTDSNGADGRDVATGRFLRGNPGGPGNPNVRRLSELQAVVRSSLSPLQLKPVEDGGARAHVSSAPAARS